MKKWSIVGLVILGILVVCVVGFTSAYNSVVKLDETAKEKWAQVENQLQRRYDLVPDLVKVANKYASHEKEVITAVVDARAKLSEATTENEQIVASTELENALSRLLVVVENYPNLKADATYIALIDEMSGSENRIAVARKDYNEAVKAYNIKIKMFPIALFRGMLGAEEKAFFEVADNVLAKPEYDL